MENEENNWTPPYMEEESEQSNERVNPESENDVQPVSWSKAKTGAVFITFLFILVIILFTIKGCRIQKKSEISSVPESTENVDVQNTAEGGLNTGKNYNDNFENFTESVSSEVGLGLKNSTEVTTESVVEGDSNSSVNVVVENGTMMAISDPPLGEEISAKGIVSGTNVYLTEGGYLYEVRIIIVTENGDSVYCSYYCPRKTFNSVYTGMGVNVIYQTDSKGIVSVSSISE